ncbi:asparagine synthase (glutamine-hydrolysing) [Saccharicrinis carchari]|uniref:asparagine synthase (glutamine-hydrolyzing) n=1 Tax=Saccharicrinis carchari TaxID=1168039 RepID=A0A521BTG9_SACCC|nr:asparagine synthase (glutamine-hydrolyzing) [Saccharicrinis carchari]SMO50355.1 asparagine synthase (glutamine-hydrolysing) [Saccharicrinis carchari]
MCGITGYINASSKPITDTSRIISMLKVQRHRGPDDSGIRAFNLKAGSSQALNSHSIEDIDGNFNGVLGFNRLSILDLSAMGHQPMLSPGGKVALAFNGEIYNAFDYKKELEEWGYQFKSTSDTEVVLALYLKYGLHEMLNRLNGMFAIVIVDLKKRSLYVARDRFGIKPMYYVSNKNVFAFSSELKCFKYINDFSFGLNPAKLDEYLLFRNNINDTLFSDIKSLKPGHFITYTHAGELNVEQFFNVNQYHRQHIHEISRKQVQQKLELCLGNSVQSQLMSDVKLGCQLSGGVDSSLVTWLANKQSKNGNFESVSIVFDDERFSEEKYIDQVSQTLGITAHKFLLDSEYYLDHFEHATWHLEAPLNHPNTIGIYKLSQRAKEYVTVLLSGEGADEVFGGYERFYDIKYPYGGLNILRQIKNNVKQPSEILDYFNEANRAIMSTAFMQPALAKMLCPQFNKRKAAYDRISLYNGLTGTRFDRQVKYEMQSYLPDLLIRQDKMSMAHSIENRVPFLDNEVVSRSFSIPEKFLLSRKNGNGTNTEKYLLKQMTAEVFGHHFAFRDKMGFGIPLREFFLKDRFNQYLNDKVLPGLKGRGVFDGKLVNNWVGNIKGLSPRELEALWVVIAFEAWASVYLDGKYKMPV